MGIAAYNRGSNAISRNLDVDQRPVEFLMMDDLDDITQSRQRTTAIWPYTLRM